MIWLLPLLHWKYKLAATTEVFNTFMHYILVLPTWFWFATKQLQNKKSLAEVNRNSILYQKNNECNNLQLHFLCKFSIHLSNNEKWIDFLILIIIGI